MTRLEWLEAELQEVEKILFDFRMEQEIAAAVGDTDNLKAYGEEIKAFMGRRKVVLKLLEKERIPQEERRINEDYQATITILRGASNEQLAE